MSGYTEEYLKEKLTKVNTKIIQDIRLNKELKSVLKFPVYEHIENPRSPF